MERWPEIKRALDSPPLDTVDRPRRWPTDEPKSGGGLKYTQTIMGGRKGGAGMRVSGRAGGREGKDNASASTAGISPILEVAPSVPQPISDGFLSPQGRPRSDSAPAQHALANPGLGTSILSAGRGLRGGLDGRGVLEHTLMEHTLSASETSGTIYDEDDNDNDATTSTSALGVGEASQVYQNVSEQVSEYALTAHEPDAPLGADLIDEGSDVDEDEVVVDAPEFDDGTHELPDPSHDRGSVDMHYDQLVFAPVPIQPPMSGQPSNLTSLLNKHVPHLVSTATDTPALEDGQEVISNPFASLYASVAAVSNIPSISLELYFPHSDTPTKPAIVKVRKDATVEEVTGYGLFRFWEDGRQPPLAEQQSDERWSTIGWGLRIVEDDGEVDEDFPRKCPLGPNSSPADGSA